MHEKKLNNNTLVLLLVDAVVLPHRDTRNRESQERRRSDSTVVLTCTPGQVRSLTRRIARRVLHLLGVTGRVEVVELGLGGLGEIREQCIGEGVGVDGGGDGVADGSAQTVEETQQGKHHGDTFAVGGGHDGHVGSDDEGAAAEGDENLGHDHVANVAVVALATEVDHETGTQDEEGETEEETGVFEGLGVADPETEDDTPEARADVVDLTHVTGEGNGEVVDDQAEVVVVQIPAVETEVGDGGETAGAKNGALLEEFVLDKVHASTPFLPGGEDEHQAESDDNHGDEGRAAVGGAAILLQTEGEEEEDPSGHQQECTDDC